MSYNVCQVDRLALVRYQVAWVRRFTAGPANYNCGLGCGYRRHVLFNTGMTRRLTARHVDSLAPVAGMSIIPCAPSVASHLQRLLT
jgi:hypothetical protein